MDKKKKNYVYTNKKHTEKGIFSTILAVISFVTLVFLLIMSFRSAGEINASYGATAFLCTLFSGVGIIIGAIGKNEPDKYYVFAYVGIIWNVVNLLFISAILYAGI